MAKRSSNEDKFITVNPFNNTAESLMAVAILNAVDYLVRISDDIHEEVKLPTRKELSKLLKNTDFKNFCKVFDEINHIRIREVPCIEATGVAGLVPIRHPIIGPIICFAYRSKDIDEYEYRLVNSGLGQDIVTVNIAHQFNDILDCPDLPCYQVFLDEGEKILKEHKEFSCDSCCRYSISSTKDYCLYDNQELATTKQCCNQYLDCFKWNTNK